MAKTLLQKLAEAKKQNQRKMPRKKKKKSKIPENYLKGSKNRSAKAAEIRRTAEAYRKGEYIDIKAVQKSRVNQDVTKKKKKSTKRKNKKSTKS